MAKLSDVLKAITHCYSDEVTTCVGCPFNEDMQNCMLIDDLNIEVED